MARFGFLILLVCASLVMATDTATYVVQAQATVQAVPPQVTLTWTNVAGGTGYSVYRRIWSSVTGFTNVASGLASTATGWTDTGVTAGTAYEYQIVRAGSPTSYGYVSAAIGLPLVDSRGSLVLLVDQTLATSLAAGLATLQQDLAADGWKVIRHDVARSTATLGNPGLTETSIYDTTTHRYRISGSASDADGTAIRGIKSTIIADVAADPALSQVLIVGHVVVPYAGNLNPDGHGDHKGAWPADTYYGDVSGTWTDTSVNVAYNGTRNNGNTPGDGRFDQSSIPGTGTQLAVGRIDLANMESFAPLTETDLLRRYLAKDHAWRSGQWQVQSRCVIEDDYGDLGGGWAPSQNGWRMASVVGLGNVVKGIGNNPPAHDTWFTRLAQPGILLAYGCGWGKPYESSPIGCTGNFVSTPAYGVFTCLFGSYFGDWNNYDSLLRAPLAQNGYGLTCMWAGRPNVVLHRLALGATIGDNLRLTQESTANRYPDGGGNVRGVHLSLMGDPTLRAHPIAPPSAPTATVAGGSVTLSWTASTTAGVPGYHIYRATSAAGPFVRRSGVVATTGTPSGSPVAGTTWTDTGVAVGSYTYLIKAVKTETTPGGTYINTSLGTSVTASVTSGTTAPVITTQPVGKTVTAGSTATFTVAASGSPAPTYQWRKGGTSIAGATSASYTTSATVLADSGSVFSVVVTNSAGSATSANATLTVTAAVPTITSFTPASSPSGTSITISGANFTGATAVSFNGKAATTYAVTSATTITATVPAGASTGRILVTTPGGSAISTASFIVTGGSVGTGTGLTGAYYDNIDFTALKLTRIDPTVNFAWGMGLPDATMGADQFSVRWTGQVQPRYTETHVFYTTSDDGVRLWVNGQLIINNWTDHGTSENSGSIALVAGQRYDLKLEFYENTGDAICQLRWSSPSLAKEVIPQTQLYPSGSGWQASYYDNRDFTGTQVQRIDPVINFAWGSNAPALGIAPDTYSVRWQARVTAPSSGTWTFTATADDGMRVWVGGTLIIDRWVDQAATAVSGQAALIAGQPVEVRMEYYQQGGDANAKLEWEGPGQARQVIPASATSPTSPSANG